MPPESILRTLPDFPPIDKDGTCEALPNGRGFAKRRFLVWNPASTNRTCGRSNGSKRL